MSMLDRFHQMRSDREQGFTLTELLVVILIIGILTAIAVPAYLNQRKTAYDASVKTDITNAADAIDTWAVECPGSAVAAAAGITVGPNSAGTTGTATTGCGAVSGGSIRVSPHTKLVVLPNAGTGQLGAYYICGFNSRGNKAVTNGFFFDSAAGGLTETKPTALASVTACAP